MKRGECRISRVPCTTATAENSFLSLICCTNCRETGVHASVQCELNSADVTPRKSRIFEVQILIFVQQLEARNSVNKL